MMLLAIIVAFALCLAWTAPAEAFFLVGVVASALAVSTAVATVIVAVGSVALSLGVSWVSQKLLASDQPQEAAQDVGGVELDLRADVDVPQSFIVGRAVTAGSLIYAETYGKRGEIDNSDLIQIIAMSDAPVTGFYQTYAENQPVALTPLSGGSGTTGVGAANRGFGVEAGYDFKIAFALYNGTALTSDALTLAALGSHPERPFTSDMVGRGVAWVRVHTVYDREKMTGPLPYRFVVDGIPLYDPRKDTTVGGAGAHRFGDLATHEFTRNLAVIIYNILRGIRVADHTGTPRHFYGLENTPAANLPLDNWFAAMNEADVVIDGEPQYHGGAEVSTATEPLETIRAILKCCDGRLSELGGIYKLRIGAPGLPVLSFDDGVLRANEGDEFKPILALEQRVNYVTGKYTAPEDGWVPKVAAPRLDADMETEDGRRLYADIDAPWVQSAAHIQRLQKQMLLRSRRARRHTIPLPPAAFGLEPGDIVEWNSERNGYVDKLFEVESAVLHSNLNSTVSLIEIDPADYDWDGETDYIEQPVGSLITNRPAPKIIEGFDAQPYIHEGANGVSRAAVLVTWDAPEDGDLDTVQVQYRRPAFIGDFATASTDEPEAEQMVIVAALTPATPYQVRGRFTSFNGFATEWSLWIDVTTPDVRVIQAELSRQLDAVVRQVNEQLAPFLALVRDELEQLSIALDGQAASTFEREGRLITGVGATAAAATAKVQQALIAIADVNQALAAFITIVEASYATTASVNTATSEAITTAVATANAALTTFQQSLLATGPGGSAQGKFRISTGSTPAGAVASIALEVNVSTTETPNWQPAGLYLDAMVGFARARIVANLFAVSHPSVNGGNPFDMFTIANISGQNVGVFSGLLYVQKLVANIVEAQHIQAGQINSSKIAIGGVDLLNIIDEAVSTKTFVFTGGVGGVSSNGVLVGSGTMTVKSGRSIVITYDSPLIDSLAGGSGDPGTITFDLRIDGGTVRTYTFNLTSFYPAIPANRRLEPLNLVMNVGALSIGVHSFALILNASGTTTSIQPGTFTVEQIHR